MSDLSKMLKEAFVGDEAFDASPGRKALEASVRKFDERMRTVRWLGFCFVTGMLAVGVFAVVMFVNIDGDSATWSMLLLLGLFLLSVIGVLFGKTWFFSMQNHLAVMKELKRTQLMMLEMTQRD